MTSFYVIFGLGPPNQKSWLCLRTIHYTYFGFQNCKQSGSTDFEIRFRSSFFRKRIFSNNGIHSTDHLNECVVQLNLGPEQSVISFKQRAPWLM